MAINNFNAKNGLSVGSNPINIVDNTANATFATAMTTGSMGVGTPVVATSRLFISGTSTATDTTLVVRAGVPSPSGRLLDIRNNAGTSVASVDYLGNIFGVSGSFSGDITITGNLTVAGTQTIVNSEVVNIKDNIVLLNANPVPAATGGIYVADTTTNTTGSLIWDSAADLWKAGKVGSEVALVSGSGTNNYVVKWNGSNALGTSVVYDDGTNVGIGTSLLDSKFVVAGNVVVSGSVNPSADNNSNYVIGTAAKRWSNVVSNAFSGSLTKLSDGVTNYLQAGANIVITTGSNGSVSVTTTGLAPSSAQYLTLTADSSLTSERIFSPGVGLKATDGGAGNNYTLSINDGIVATVSGTTFTGVTNHNAGLSGSLTRLTNGTSYLIAGNNMQITTGSTGAVTISSTATGATYVAGADTQVQFNDGGTFGADADFIFDKTNNLLKVTNISGSITSSNVSAGQVVLAGSGGVLSGSNNLFWVNSNSNLVVGAGTTSADPANRLQLSDNQTNLRGMEFRPGSINYIISYNRGTPGYLPFHLGASTFKFSDGSYTNFIDSVGNVGVGMSGAVTSVSSKLLVSGSATASTPTTTIREGVASPIGGVGVLDVQNSAGTSILFVSGSGRVGVGTSVLSTSNKFEVYQGRLAISGYSSELYLEGSNSGYSTITSFGAGNYKDLWLRTVSGTTDGIWIKSLTGNVGIGTSLLDSRFVVNGNVVVSGSVNPDIDATRDLGTSTKRWRNLYATNISGSLTGSNVSEGQIIVAGAGGVLSGSNNFWWDNINNNVGIGTSGGFNNLSATESTLHISNSNVSTIYLSSTATGKKWSILSAAGGTFSVRDNTGSAYRIVVNSAGNVGIGSTLTVSAQLQVSGSSVASTPTMVVREGVVSPTGGVGVLDVQNSVATSLLFVSGSGRVGIGVTIPNASLDILSSVPGASEIRSSGNNVYQVFRRSTNTTVGYIGSGASLVSSGGSNSDFGIAAPAAGANLILVTGATERLRVDSSGNVGIGTVDANGNRLAISGGNLSVTGSVLPGVTTTYDIGSTTYRWRDVYARTGSFSGDVTITGDLTVNGTQFIVNTQIVEIEDNAILLNAGPSPAATGGIYVADTTTGVTGSLLWDSVTDRWKAGKLGSEVSLVSGSGTNNYVTKWSGANAVGSSIIYDDGTNVGVGTGTPANKFHIFGSSNDTVNRANANLTVEGGGGNGFVFGTYSTSRFASYIQSGFVSNFGTATYVLSLNPLGGNVGIGTSTTTDSLAVNGSMSVTGSMLPGTDVTYTLGNTTKRWSNVVSNALTGSLTKLSDGTTDYLQAGSNIAIVTGSNGSVTISTTGLASTTAQYLTLAADASLTSERVFTPSTGLKATDGGAGGNYTLTINDSVVATVSGTTFTGVTNHNAGLSGSLTKLTDGTSYLIAGAGITIATGSNGSVTITGNLGDITSVTAGNGLLGGGTSGDVSLSINDSIVATVSGTTFTGVTRHNAGLSGSLTRLTDGTSYIVAGSNITAITGSNGSITLATTGLAPVSSAFLTIGNDSTLTNERSLSTGTGLLAVDGGANSTYTLSINNSIVATVSGTTFTGVTNHNAGLSGSLTKLTDGTSYIVAGQNIQIATGSNGSITITSVASGASYVAGATTQVQFNDGGTFGADSDFTFDKNSNLLKVTNISGSLTGSNVLAGHVVVAGTGGVLSGSNLLFWDNSNGRLGIGTSSPDARVRVFGDLYAGTPSNGGEIRLANSFTRVALMDSGGGWFGGYNVKGDASPATTMQHDSLGVSAGIWFNSTGVRFFTDTSAAAGTVISTPSATIDTSGNFMIGTTVSNNNRLSVNGVLAATGSILPGISNTHSLGSSTKLWSTVYATNLSGSLTKLSDGTSYLIAGNNIAITTGSSGAVTISTTGLPPLAAAYLTVGNDATLTNERSLAAGSGLTATDGGANGSYTLSINDSVVATVSGTTFTGTTKHSAGLSGSLTNLTDGTSYLIAGPGISIVSQSNGSILITGSSQVTLGGFDTYVQFNDGGAFGGDANFTFNKTTDALKVTNISGSLTRLADGSPYLIAGSNVTLTTGSNGSITIDSSVLPYTTSSFTNATSLTINHTMGVSLYDIEVFDTSYNKILPKSATATSSTQANITFGIPTSGYVIVGGPGGGGSGGGGGGGGGGSTPAYSTFTGSITLDQTSWTLVSTGTDHMRTSNVTTSGGGMFISANMTFYSTDPTTQFFFTAARSTDDGSSWINVADGVNIITSTGKLQTISIGDVATNIIPINITYLDNAAIGNSGNYRYAIYYKSNSGTGSLGNGSETYALSAHEI